MRSKQKFANIFKEEIELLSVEEEFHREEIFRQFISNVRRALIILSILPDSILSDITTTLMFLGAGVVQVQTALSYPEIVPTYINKIESEIYVEIQSLEGIVLETITRLRGENIFAELVEVIRENNIEGYEECVTRIPQLDSIFAELEQKIRELI